MKEIRVQDLVPKVYPQKSRDFQVFCRLADLVWNQMKLDVDLIQYLVTTEDCKNNLLALLQTKIGFFTKFEYTDDMLRYFLATFPSAIRYKGTLTAIQYAVNAYVKANDIKDEVIVEKDVTDVFNIKIKTTHKLKEANKLDEYLAYILPAGLTYKFEFYVKMPDLQTSISNTNLGYFTLSDNKTNAAIRYFNDLDQSYAKDDFDKLIVENSNEWSSRYSMLVSEPSDWADKYTTYYTFDGSNYISVPLGSTAPAFSARIYYRDLWTRYRLIGIKPSNWPTNCFKFDATTKTYVSVPAGTTFTANIYYTKIYTKDQLGTQQIYNDVLGIVGMAGLSGSHDSAGEQIAPIRPLIKFTDNQGRGLITNPFEDESGE